MSAALFGDSDGSATVSKDGVYRYDLTRRWGDGHSVLWIMLNPSTADASIDDPTIRRCIGFTKAWGYGGLTVCNLFALRATDPRELERVTDPIGPDNDSTIMGHAKRDDVDRVVCAWGAHPAARIRALSVRYLMPDPGTVMHCLGTTRDGHPRHPLYVKADQPLVRFPAPLPSPLPAVPSQQQGAA